MNTMDKLYDLQNRRSTIEQGGGAEKIQKQHNQKKLTARERINLLMDKGSFIEVDAFAKHRCKEFDMNKNDYPGEGVITGYGTVDGRLIFVYSQDFSVMGGAVGEMHAKKITKIMDMALKMGAPVIGMCDSGGARIQEGVDALSGFGDIFYKNTLLSGVVPQISLVMGPCAGGAAFSPAMTDFIFMVDKTSQMFVTGPQVVKAVTDKDISKEELGSAKLHSEKSGVTHFTASSEEECINKLKQLLSFLPSNNLEDAYILENQDEINRLSERFTEIVPDDPNEVYDMKEIITEVVDNGEFLEIQKGYAQNIIVGFGRMNGSSVGIVANQPKVLSGALDIDASDKAARFVRFCDSFNIPIITFTDVPGYSTEITEETNGIIRHGAKLLYAFSEATVPKVNVIVRKAYGGAYVAMNSKHLGADTVLAWPTAQIAVMNAEGAANIIFRNEIANSADPINERQKKIQEYRDKFANPYMAASRGYIDDVIEPDSTRPRIIAALEMLASKRENRPTKKHGNIPV